MQGLDIIIFAGIAVFFILKLLGVIGQRSEEEETNNKPKKNIIDINQRYQEAKKLTRNKNYNAKKESSAVIIDITSKTKEDAFNNHLNQLDIKPNSKIGKGLKKIQGKIPDFNPVEFTQGAESAFEMILGAFASGELPLLKNLLTKDVYKIFETSITQRKKNGEQMKLTILAIESVEIIQANVKGNELSLSVVINSEQNSVTYDKENNVIAGDVKDKISASDIWTFNKTIQSSGPNWYLAATGSAED